MRSNPLDLSILIRGGKEINEDSRSTGEGKEKSQSRISGKTEKCEVESVLNQEV